MPPARRSPRRAFLFLQAQRHADRCDVARACAPGSRRKGTRAERRGDSADPERSAGTIRLGTRTLRGDFLRRSRFSRYLRADLRFCLLLIFALSDESIATFLERVLQVIVSLELIKRPQ